MDHPAVQILGIRFFVGSAAEAATQMTVDGGVLIVPAAPALVRLEHDPVYREAIARADLAIPDSGFMVLLWRIFRRERLSRVSGLAYLKALLAMPATAGPRRMFFVLPNDIAREKLLAWAAANGRAISGSDCYVAPIYSLTVQDDALLAMIGQQRPAHVVVAIGNGPQEKLGYYLRQHLSYRPAIHCVGAALGFITGEQVAIPSWADRFYLGWLLRLIAQPRIFIPRLARALRLPWLILRYGSALPALQQ